MFTWTLVILSVWMSATMRYRAMVRRISLPLEILILSTAFQSFCLQRSNRLSTRSNRFVYSVPIVCLQRSNRFVYSVQLFSEVCTFSHPVQKSLHSHCL